MSFIKNDCVVLIKKTVTSCFCQKHSVGHHLDQGFFRMFFRKTDTITHHSSDFCFQFMGDLSGNRGGSNSPGLGQGNSSPASPASLKTEFRQLGGFPGSCFTGDNQDLMRFQGFQDLILVFRNRKLRGKNNSRLKGFSSLKFILGNFGLFQQFQVIGFKSLERLWMRVRKIFKFC